MPSKKPTTQPLQHTRGGTTTKDAADPDLERLKAQRQGRA